MTQTALMRADEIAHAFNGATERQYWRAAVAGSRLNPEIHFNSRATMVKIAYRLATEEFTVVFARTDACWGDFLASTYKAMAQVLPALKAAGLPFAAPLGDTGTLRVEYDPRSKTAVVRLANLGDDWPERSPSSFKVPERPAENNFLNSQQSTISGVDQ